MVLMSGNELLVQTNTNEHGEFQIDFKTRRGLRLHIPVDDRVIEVPLTGVADTKSGNDKSL